MISGLLSLAGAAILVVIDQLIKHWATAALLPVTGRRRTCATA